AVFPQESVLLAFGCIRSSDDLAGRAQSGHQAVLAAQRSQVQALAALPEQAVDGAVVSLSTIFGPGDLARSVGEQQEVALLTQALEKRRKSPCGAKRCGRTPEGKEGLPETAPRGWSSRSVRV